MGDKEPLKDSQASHGMCQECIEHFPRQWRGLSLAEYLDSFDYPVLVADGNMRIVVANQPMANMMGKEKRDVAGLLGGEAIECAYARLEGECGHTVHCQTCTARNATTEAWETGETVLRERCFVQRNSGKQYFLITTVKLERSVQVTIEPEQGA
jgi:PAS domain-containing protein